MTMRSLPRLAAAAGVAALLALPPVCAAQQRGAHPFANANIEAGRKLHDKDCVACHARRFDGDAAKMYTRADRKVRTPDQLRAQVAWCNTQLGTQYFPDDEDNVAGYLDRRYYHFK